MKRIDIVMQGLNDEERAIVERALREFPRDENNDTEKAVFIGFLNGCATIAELLRRESLAEAFDKLQELFDQFLGGKHPWSNTEGRKVDKRIH
jgi:hypothetical protein